MSESNVQFSEREALLFHSQGRPGKIEIVASKPMATQRDLSLAYSPGVAVPVRATDGTVAGALAAIGTTGRLPVHDRDLIDLLAASALRVSF